MEIDIPTLNAYKIFWFHPDIHPHNTWSKISYNHDLCITNIILWVKILLMLLCLLFFLIDQLAGHLAAKKH